MLKGIVLHSIITSFLFQFNANGSIAPAYELLSQPQGASLEQLRLFEKRPRFRWDLGPFSDCTVMCGRGTQNRTVECREIPEGRNYSYSPYEYRPKGKLMPDLMCPAPKPQEVQACSQVACPQEWVYGPWKRCSKSCGRGIQTRVKRCMQKLGTGRTVQLPQKLCQYRKPPVTTRLCNHRRTCSSRWFFSRWSACQVTCGDGIQTRSVLCGIIKAGRKTPTRVPSRLCSNRRKPASERVCSTPGCSNNSSGPIRIRKNKFIQNHAQLKVFLHVGELASLIPGTTVIIKCPVENFPRKSIRWSYGGQLIRSASRIFPKQRFKSRVRVLRDGSLLILQTRREDAGKYTCHAGSASAFSVIDFVSNPKDSHDQTVSQPNELDIRTTTKAENSFRTGSRSISSPRPASLLAAPQRKIPFTRRLPVFVPTLAPVPQVVRPRISLVQARPVLEVDFRLRDFPEQANDFDRYQHSSRSGNEVSTNLIRKILNHLGSEEARHGFKPVNALLNQLMRTTTLFEHGVISAEERKRRNSHVYRELHRLTNNNQDRITARGNTARSTDFASSQLINRFLEGLPEPATIISQQSTVIPLQLEREVTAYVGGHLMVANAERVTILCETSGNPEPKITWYRNGNKIPEISRRKRQFVLREGSLRLLYLQLSDAGSYKCVASNLHGNDSKTTELSVMRKPRILSTTVVLEDFQSERIEATIGSDIRAKLGSRIIIHCPAEGYPDPYVVWRKDASGLGQNTKVLADNSIEIFPATAEYQGLFGCEASSPAGSDYQASSLVLIDPPRVTGKMDFQSNVDEVAGLPELLLTGRTTEAYEVKANSTVMMGCPIVGFPTPTLTWFFNDSPLDETSGFFEHELMKSGKVLQIMNVDQRVGGNFSCSAKNGGGTLSTSLRLRIVDYSFDYGDHTTCSASCGSTGTQSRKIVCLRDGAVKVDEWYCTGLRKPGVVITPCNQVDCPPKFILGSWSSCSATCGNGTRTRSSSCVVIMSDGSTREVAVEACAGNPVAPIEQCSEPKCPEWRVGSWRSCSRKCFRRGVGMKTRRIHCIDSNGKKIRNRHCLSLSKPKRRIPCSNSRCLPVWVTSPWSVCSQSCGFQGIKTRIVNCVYRGRKKQPAGNQCSSRRLPAIKLPCNRKRCGIGKVKKNRKTKSSASCVDHHSWCRRVVSLNLCKRYSKSCCRSCKK